MRTGLVWSDREQNLNDPQNYDHILALEKAIDGRNKNALRNFYRHASWGRYVIEGDIIKAQHMEKPDIMSSFNGASEEWFKIINSKTIAYMGGFKFPISQSKREEQIKEILNAPIKNEIFLTQTNLIPPFGNAWILKEKWFWCNENAWKEFMKNRKK